MPYFQKYLEPEKGMACFSKDMQQWYLGDAEVSLTELIEMFEIPSEEAVILLLTYGN